jgi:hypothetical protein
MRPAMSASMAPLSMLAARAPIPLVVDFVSDTM